LYVIDIIDEKFKNIYQYDLVSNLHTNKVTKKEKWVLRLDMQL